MKNNNLEKITSEEKAIGEEFQICIADTLAEKKRYINSVIKFMWKKCQNIN